MNGRRFDEFSKALGSAGSRRGFFRVLAGGVAGLLGVRPASAGVAACGTQAGQPCCPNNTCSGSGLSCLGGTCYALPCGGTNQPCCSNITCFGGLSCNFATGTCGSATPCGASGEPCCSGGICNPNLSLVCLGGTCQPPCGGSNQPCCTAVGVAPCSSSTLACIGGTCLAAGSFSCGISGKPCCGNNTCFGGLTCNFATGICGSAPPCGASGEPCCSGGICNPNLSLVCLGGTCQPPCGGSNQPCCTTVGVAPCNSSTLACIGGACLAAGSFSCGISGKPCCGNITCFSGICVNGVCCDSGLSNCSGTCVNEQTDVNNCGACGQACPIPLGGQATCINGQCGVACPSGTTPCGSGLAQACVNLQADLHNCGACGHACPIPLAGQATCINGGCGVACPSGTTRCGSGLAQACVNLQTDVHNCGACGSACTVPAGGSATCTNGQCVPTCPPQMHVCLTSISPPAIACAECCWYSVQTDCPTAPPANATVACTNGVCGFTCNSGFKPCGLINGQIVSCIPVNNCCTLLDCPVVNGFNVPCTNGQCQLNCPPLTTQCGTTCCGGTCCPDGHTCCGLTQTCTPGAGIGDLPWGCCDSTLLSPEICGGVCCAPGKTCRAELFPHFYQACCGPNDTICGQDSACCPGTCCQDGHCCPSPGGCHNGTCCPTGIICNGVCGQICPNGTPGASETCCPLGQNCCPTDLALGTGCCTATQVCGQFGCGSPGTV